ncbi:MAG: hypothetical protein AAFQ94_25590 [Bacteroidota bacterium]
MKKLLIILLVLKFYSCPSPEKREADQEITHQREEVNTTLDTLAEKQPDVITVGNEPLTFSDKIGRAVLLGEPIHLLNPDLENIMDISSLAGQIVKVTGISDSLMNQGIGFEEFCKSFWYVKIQIDTLSGIVNGRNVFEINKSRQDTSFIIDNTRFEFFTTDFLGMGVEYDGDLMGCPVDQPILFKTNNYEGLVELNINEFSKKASWDNDYPFFELKDDDGSYDRITSATLSNDSLVLNIRRDWQEGWNFFDVLIQSEDDTYTATYLNFGERFYE